MTVSHSVVITGATATLFGVLLEILRILPRESQRVMVLTFLSIHGWFSLYVVLGMVVIGSTRLYKSTSSWKPASLSAIKIANIQYYCLNHFKPSRKKRRGRVSILFPCAHIPDLPGTQQGRLEPFISIPLLFQKRLSSNGIRTCMSLFSFFSSLKGPAFLPEYLPICHSFTKPLGPVFHLAREPYAYAHMSTSETN